VVVVVLVVLVLLGVIQLLFLQVMVVLEELMAVEPGFVGALLDTRCLLLALLRPAMVPMVLVAMARLELFGPVVLGLFLQPEQQMNRKNNGTLYSYC
jgi:hypothetical protein